MLPTASLTTDCTQISARPELVNLLPAHAQFILDVCARCRLDDIQLAANESLLAQLSKCMLLNDGRARIEVVKQLILLRNDGHLSELEAAILITRAKHLAPDGASKNSLQGPGLG